MLKFAKQRFPYLKYLCRSYSFYMLTLESKNIVSKVVRPGYTLAITSLIAAGQEDCRVMLSSYNYIVVEVIHL